MDTKLLSTDRPIALYYAFLSEVASMTLVGDSKCNVVLAGTDWRPIATTIGTIDLQEESSETRAGTLYTNNLTATCPGHDETTPGDIVSISGRKLILRLDYRNGLKKIIGSKTTGPKLEIKTSSNTTTSRKIQSNFKTTAPNRWLV